MIEVLTGKIIKKVPSYILVDVNDIGYKITISLNCYDKLPDLNSKATILIHFHITDNNLGLYGFLDETEKDLFRMLIGISGIGPKTAINMLSAVPPLEFRNRLIAGEVKMLTTLPGIGPKTARRIIIELKDKFGEFDKEELPLEESSINDDAFYALKKLGFSPKIIRDKIIEIQNKNNALDTEGIIKEALKLLNE